MIIGIGFGTSTPCKSLSLFPVIWAVKDLRFSSTPSPDILLYAFELFLKKTDVKIASIDCNFIKPIFLNQKINEAKFNIYDISGRFIKSLYKRNFKNNT